MKLKHLLSGILFLAAVAVIGCKGKPSKDMVVNKWKISNLSGGMAKDMPDSVKKEMSDKLTLEFTKDGKYMMTGGGADEKGDYTISDDLKTLTMTRGGTGNGGKSMPHDINELSKDKVVLTEKESNTQITLAPR